jgi:hypothetical protein
MRCFAVVIAVASVLFAVMPAQADLIGGGQDLVLNGGMEQPGWNAQVPTNWSKLSGNFEVWTSSAHSESFGVSAYSGGGAYQLRTFDGFTANVGSIDFSGWTKSESAYAGADASMTFEIGRWNGSSFDSTGYYSTTVVNNGGTAWQQLSASLPVSHGTVEANAISITLRNTVGSQCAYFDDIAATTVATPEPNAMFLLGLGALSLMAYAWRKRR